VLERGVVVVVGRDPAVGAILRPHCVLRHGGRGGLNNLSGRLGRRARSRSRSQRRSTAQTTACARPPKAPSCAPARSPTAPGCATRRVTSTPRSAHRIHPALCATPPAAGLSTAAVGRRLRRTDRPPPVGKPCSRHQTSPTRPQPTRLQHRSPLTHLTSLGQFR